MANILITGGAGFIGSHTADKLVGSGHKVRVLDILDCQIHGETVGFPPYMNADVECIRGDVRNPADVASALEGIDVVYHLAALTGVGQSMYDIRSYVDTNCTGTATLLEAIVKRNQPIKKFILSSSRAVYGEGSHECPVHGTIYPAQGRRTSDMEKGRFEVFCPHCDGALRPIPTAEDRPLAPISVYAWTKKQQEEQCQYVAKTFEIPVIILRYFNVYGSRQSLKNPYTGIVSIFYSRIVENQPISIYEHGTPIRDFVHVSDVAQANHLSLEADVKPGTRINIGTGMQTTIHDVAGALGAACGSSPRMVDTGEFRVGDIHSCYADLTKARRFLGFEPIINLKEGIEEFVTWAKNEHSSDLYEKTVQELKRYGLFGRIQSKEGEV